MSRLFSSASDSFFKASIKQVSFSLTLGVFLGAALTTGAAAGLAAFWLANEKVMRRIRAHALNLVFSARDAALGTQEGQALSRALLSAPGAADAGAVASAAPVDAALRPSDELASLQAALAEVRVATRRAEERCRQLEAQVSENAA